MSRRPPSLLVRLRRHRGVWMLALAVLLFKITMSTFCALDGPRVAFTDGSPAAPIAVQGTNADADDYCALGEGGGCHCTCVHAVALPTHATVMAIAERPSSLRLAVTAGESPAFARSPLRPPIS
ncbi:hypothetical protein HBF26_00985 [Luteibacter jiangsuensis]|uniref:DUF2946 family protein n=1 Tax=Luteibacter jiangsuensis TaxID=637577 RepID=A0ABX0PYA0_9GAMM|nr:hypothetical protein [Luteibacter jiangsuensis]NID03444.1 hypothetical protein [Luteibacter jiangsuensis]